MEEEQARNNMIATVAEYLQNNPQQLLVDLHDFEDYEDGDRIMINDILNEFNRKSYRAIQYINYDYEGILFERSDLK